MSDWAETAMLHAFPREGTTYFLQLVDEPTLVEKKGQWGLYTLLVANLQFFAIDDDEKYHYMGPLQFTGKSCVFEDFTHYRHILLEVCYKVVGYKHGKHVDLDIKETFDRQYPSRTITETTPPTPPPPAAVVAPDWTERDKTLEKCAAAGEPCPDCSSQKAKGHRYCENCGEGVG